MEEIGITRISLSGAHNSLWDNSMFYWQVLQLVIIIQETNL